MENAVENKRIMVITYYADTYIKPKECFSESDKDALYLEIKKGIQVNSYFWLPWKNRAEVFPKSEIKSVTEGVYSIFLLNKGAKKQLYRIQTDGFYFSEDDRDVEFKNKNGEKTIADFKNIKSQLWIKITDIQEQEKPSEFLKNYSFCPDINPGESKQFEKLYNKRVFGRSFLIKSEYCIFFLRKDDDAQYPETQLKPRQSKYAKVFTTVEGNRILLISDLHCPFEEPRDKTAPSHEDKLLSVAKCKKPSALIVAGDFSDKSNLAGYDDAARFISRLCVQNNIMQEALVFVPGNHDIGYSDETGINLEYSKETTKKQYKIFYKEMLSCDPKQSLCRGSKIILKNGLPVEILGLNSIPYEQEADQRGFGLLTDAHLKKAASQMGWNENDRTYAYRILVFHHPLFPVGDRSNYDKNERKQEVIINAQTVYNFINTYGINLVITGHAHTDGYLRFFREGDFGGECIWLGLGSCGSQCSEKSIYCLNFDKYGEVEFFRAIGKGDNCNFDWEENPKYSFNVDVFSRR